MANTRRGGSSDWQRQQQALAREAEKQRREAERARQAAEKEAKRQHLAARAAEVDRENRALAARVEELRTILRQGLTRSARIDPRSLYRRPSVPALHLGALAVPSPRPDWARYAPSAPGAFSRILGGAGRHERATAEAKASFERDTLAWQQAEDDRQRRVVAARAEHAELVRRDEALVSAHNTKVDAVGNGIRARAKAAVEEYLGLVLARVPLPKGCPRVVDVAYSPQHEQVVVQFELPDKKLIPEVANYQYLSTKDEQRPVARKPKEINDLHRSVVSQIALLCVRDVFNADERVTSVGLNGHMHRTNPATGVREYPCVISLNVDRADFPMDTNLREVTPELCVRNLKAIVSNHPYELEPIEPILNFDLSRYSFVDGLDAVATLDSRPDLMQMSPTNFEHLVRQLFEAQGLEGWTTTQSNDDGVDAVIANKTSIVGGLAIVQAKRYSIVVGINHVRELAGAIEEKKAGKGILVTTSWFTAKCHEKAREHGRMELIDGGQLVFLIKEHLGKDVLIGIANRPKRHQSSAEPN